MHNGVWKEPLHLWRNMRQSKRMGKNWPHLRHNVRHFVHSCPTYQEMDDRYVTIRASRFVLLTDGENLHWHNRSFTFRYGTEIHYCDHWYFHTWQRVVPEIRGYGDSRCRHIKATHVSLYGTTWARNILWVTFRQLINTLPPRDGIAHHTTIPYSRKVNGIVERANKEMNRHIRNILFDIGHVKNWSRLLCTTERVLNNSVKQPLGYYNLVMHSQTTVDAGFRRYPHRTTGTNYWRSDSLANVWNEWMNETDMRNDMVIAHEPQNIGKC